MGASTSECVPTGEMRYHCETVLQYSGFMVIWNRSQRPLTSTWELLLVPLDQFPNFSHLRRRKRGRVVEGSGFENRRRESVQGFESLRFRRSPRLRRGLFHARRA